MLTNRSSSDVLVSLEGWNTAGTFTTGTGAGTVATLLGGNIGENYTSVNTFTIQNPGYQATFPTYDEFWKFNEEFDILWKSFFDPNAGYKPIKEKISSVPCDIQETDNGLRIEVAAVGLEKDELDIIVDSETLRIAYRKTDKEEEAEKNEYRYLLRSIKKASFDIAWKISSKYDLAKLEAKLDKGLLIMDIPFAKENKPKKVTIK